MKEFTRIAEFLAPLVENAPEALELQDDAALIPAGAGTQYAITKDAIVEGVHFLPGTEAGLIAKKLLRTNLSDLAAMGATPRFFLIAAALPASIEDAWYRSFTAALAEKQALWNMYLIGGDTVSTSGALVLSFTAIGEVPEGAALLRSGARVGDSVYVSGSLGDAAMGLKLLLPLPPGEGWGEGAITRHSVPLSPQGRGFLIQRYHIPEPRVELGLALREVATSCMDISDGLLGDATHICKVSGVGMQLAAEKLPLSDAAKAAGITTEVAATGGDDYELLFTVLPEREAALKSLSEKLALPITRIGEVIEGSEVILLDANGNPLQFAKKGYEH